MIAAHDSKIDLDRAVIFVFYGSGIPITGLPHEGYILRLVGKLIPGKSPQIFLVVIVAVVTPVSGLINVITVVPDAVDRLSAGIENIAFSQKFAGAEQNH